MTRRQRGQAGEPSGAVLKRISGSKRRTTGANLGWNLVLVLGVPQAGQKRSTRSTVAPHSLQFMVTTSQGQGTDCRAIGMGARQL